MRLGSYYRKILLHNIGIEATGQKVLDVGGFDGYWLHNQKSDEKIVLDIDIDPKYDDVIYKRGNALEMPFEEDKFDQVFALDVIEHVPLNNEKILLNEIIRITKKGGEIVLTIPSARIRIFPHFMTDWVSRKWGHKKYNGLSTQQVNDLVSDLTIKDCIINDSNSRNFLDNYLWLRALWSIYPGLTKKIIKKYAILDTKNLSGENGYLIIKITK